MVSAPFLGSDVGQAGSDRILRFSRAIIDPTEKTNTDFFFPKILTDSLA